MEKRVLLAVVLSACAVSRLSAQQPWAGLAAGFLSEVRDPYLLAAVHLNRTWQAGALKQEQLYREAFGAAEQEFALVDDEGRRKELLAAVSNILCIRFKGFDPLLE